MGGSKDDEGHRIAVDGSGNVYITGEFQGKADFDPGSGTASLISAGLSDVFVAKYDSSGNYVWAGSMGSTAMDQGWAIATDSSGNMYVTGAFTGKVDFDLGTGAADTFYLTSSPLLLFGKPFSNSYDIFISKLDPNGNFLWAKNVGGYGQDYGRGIAVDGSGNVYVSGNFNGTVDFDPGPGVDSLEPVGISNNAFLAKYDRNGDYIWAKNMGGNDGETLAWDLALDGSGNAYITGYFNAPTVDFDPGPDVHTLSAINPTPQGFDVFIAKYDAGGNYLWAGSMGGSEDDRGYGVASSHGNAYVAGYFHDTVNNFNPGQDTLISMGNSDVFFAKYVCNDTSSSYLTVSLPCGESYVLNDSVYTATGNYTQVFPNAGGCDSMVTLDLTILPLDQPVINVDSFTLGVTGTYAIYQWIKDSVLIPGATNRTYTVTENGNYWVVVTNGKGCSNTSDVYPITNYTGITDVQLLSKYIKVYPNPADDIVHIQSPVSVYVTLTDIAGRIIKEINDAHNLSIKDLDAGMYMLRITDENGTLIKVVKEIKQGK